MQSKSQILNEVYEKCGEWLEMVPEDQRSNMIIDMLCTMMVKERENNINRRYKDVCAYPANR